MAPICAGCGFMTFPFTDVFELVVAVDGAVIALLVGGLYGCCSRGGRELAGSWFVAIGTTDDCIVVGAPMNVVAVAAVLFEFACGLPCIVLLG